MAKRTSKSAKAKAPARKVVAKPKALPKAKPAKLATKAKPLAKSAEVTTKKSEGKKLSTKLLEAIEKRQSAKADVKGKQSNPFGRPMGRRGRRPKRLAEYTPTNGDEPTSDQPENEAQNESLEYDTGIRVKEVQTEDMFSMDRFEDYDEELNFDR